MNLQSRLSERESEITWIAASGARRLVANPRSLKNELIRIFTEARVRVRPKVAETRHAKTPSHARWA